jgi:hypothetical protein
MIMDSLLGNLSQVHTNLICYGANGVTTFQGPKTWVMMELNEKHVSFTLELFIKCLK